MESCDFSTKITLYRVCFPVNFQKIFRAGFLQNTSAQLLPNKVDSTKKLKEWMTNPNKTNQKIISETYSEPSRISKMEFIKKVTIFTICSILDVCTEFWIRFCIWHFGEQASAYFKPEWQKLEINVYFLTYFF